MDAIAEVLKVSAVTDLGTATLNVEMELKVCNNGKKVIIGNKSAIEPIPNTSLINALKTAHEIKQKYLGMESQSLTDIAASMNMNKRQVWRDLKLAFLAPDIQIAILSGTQPTGLCVQDLLNTKMPIEWPEQRAALGFT